MVNEKNALIKADLGMLITVPRLKKHFSTNCSSLICSLTNKYNSSAISVSFST
jgi:hypothetical protein